MEASDVTIRLMTPADYEAVYRLWLSTPGMALNNVDDSPTGFARYLRRNPATCFVAEKDGQLVGTILAGHDGRRGFIYHTAVAPDCRRQGIGSTLVEAALNALQTEGIIKAALVVWDHNKTGNSFWERQGFRLRSDLSYRDRELAETKRIDT